VRAVEGWKGMWKAATLKVGEVDVRAAGGDMEDEGDILFQKREGELERAEVVLEEFGKELVRMTEQVFATQANALRNAPWTKKAAGGRKKGDHVTAHR